MTPAGFISALILASSGFLLLFWLRTACQSILRHRFEQNYGVEVAEANQLEFPAIRQALTDLPAQEADGGSYLTALERDYEALTYLLRNVATVHVGRYTPRERLLIMDFQLLRVWVRLQRAVNWRGWQASLLEMTDILDYFAGTLGERVATLAR